jgi:hypothetical protein
MDMGLGMDIFKMWGTWMGNIVLYPYSIHSHPYILFYLSTYFPSIGGNHIQDVSNITTLFRNLERMALKRDE